MGISRHEYFYASNGAVLKNKDDLLKFFKSIDEKTFHSHVNSEKNDFANWTTHVLKNETLGKKLKKLHSSTEMIAAMEEVHKRKERRRTDKKSIIQQLIGAITGDD